MGSGTCEDDTDRFGERGKTPVRMGTGGEGFQTKKTKKVGTVSESSKKH